MPERLVLRPDMFLKVVDIVMLLFDEALYHIDMYLYHKKTVAIQLNQSADRRTIDWAIFERDKKRTNKRMANKKRMIECPSHDQLIQVSTFYQPNDFKNKGL